MSNSPSTNEGCRWIDVPRAYRLEREQTTGEYQEKKFLNENFTRCPPTHPKVKFTLLPHQRHTTAAMIDLETRRYVDLMSDDVAPYNRVIAETSAGVLSEKPGSGKTFAVLYLIAASQLRRVSEITTLPFPRPKSVTNRNFTLRDAFVDYGFTHEVRTSYDRLMPQTLIFVGKSVINQWREAIEENTSFKVFCIDGVQALWRFYYGVFGDARQRAAVDLKAYDIILVKNSTISGKFDPPQLRDTPLENSKTRYILNVFGELCRTLCWTRVVLDDFDTLQIPTTALAIPALFTWLVSATKKTAPSGRNVRLSGRLEDLLAAYRPLYTRIWHNRELFTFFNIGCCNELIDSSTRASKVAYYLYRFVNPNENYIGLMATMGTDEAREISEMLNGDAIGQAAARAGIKTDSVADIFERILDKKWDLYRRNLRIEMYLPRARTFVESLPALVDSKRAITAANLDTFRKNLRKPGPYSQLPTLAQYKQTSLHETIKEVDDDNRREKEENGIAIQRVKDNLREGDCPITGESLAEATSIVIMKCCGLVISGEAIFALKLQSGANDVRGRCPKCRSDINFKQNLIYIDRDQINLEEVVDDKVLDDDPELAPEVEPEPAPEPKGDDLPDDLDELDILDVEPGALLDDPVEEDTEELNKYSCIIKIVKGQDDELTELRQQRNVHIPNLLSGDYDAGEPAVGERKTLVFANFRETIENIERRLVRHRIPYLRLYGTPQQIKNAVERFHRSNSDPEAIAVLLINGAKYCAGLNLQNATDLIFTHRVIDPNLESQIAGRAARYGRTANLRIHYTLYENEFSSIMH